MIGIGIINIRFVDAESVDVVHDYSFLLES